MNRLCGYLLGTSLCFCGTAYPQAANWPSERPPRPLASHDVRFPPYDVRTLPNGLQVVVVLHHGQPAVSMRLLIRAGSASDPTGKLGLARLLASLLDQGTATKSAQELNEQIDFIGGELGTGAAPDLSYITAFVLKDSFTEGLGLVSEMARHPAFTQEEIERQRQHMLSGLQVSFQDPEWIANAVFNRLVYGFHPYGLPASGTPETIAGITRDDLLAFHAKYFAPNNALLAIVGDVTADEAFSAATQAFGDWLRHDVPQEKFIKPPDSTRRVIVVNKPDAVQTEVRVGQLGIARKVDDYMAVNLAIRILGGEGSNRLHQVLRTDRGLTYGAQANMNTFKESGDFEAQTNTRSEATGEVLRLIIDEFRRLQDQRVGGRELASAQAYMTGSFPLTIETPNSIATQVLHLLFYGLPLQDLQTVRDRVNEVTTEQIQEVARAYLLPDRLSIVLVGNAAAFTSQLRRAGIDRFEVVDLENLDLTSANFKGPAAGAGRVGQARGPVALLASLQQPQGSPSGAAMGEGAKARVLLDRVIAAKGGLPVLRAIKRLKAVTSASVTTIGGQVDAQTTTYLEYPNRVRVETTVLQGTEIQVYDGERAWVRDPFGIHEVSARATRDMEASLRRDTIAALLAAARGDLRIRLLPDIKDEHGKLGHALEVSSPALEPLVLSIDPDTSLITKQTYVASGPGQPLVEEVFSDYRLIDGVQVAFTAEVRRGGQSMVRRRLTELTINPTLDSALFTRPTS